MSVEKEEKKKKNDTAEKTEKSDNAIMTGNKKNENVLLYRAFVKWTVIAVIVGIVVGAAGALFHHALDFATEFRTENPVIIYALPVAGLLIILLYKGLGMADDRGTNAVILEARGEKRIRLRLAPAIVTATFLTHLCGGSAGREGAALQLGASLASPLGRIFKFDRDDCSVLAMCGMAAGFSALFGTPAAAAIFAMEVTVVGVAEYAAIVPCMTAAAVSGVTAAMMGIHKTSFGTVNAPVFGGDSAMTVVKVIILSILAAIVSIIFCEIMKFIGSVYKKYIKNPYLRVLAGSAIMIAATLLLGTYDYNGAGTHVIEAAFRGEVFPLAFLIKIVLTAVTLGSGFKGGEIVPAFFAGSTFGCAVAPLLGLDPSFAAAIGLVAVFCGVTNCPIASMVIGVELFGAEGIIFYAAAAGVSYMLSGYQGLYSEQTFYHSKIKPVEYSK